MGDQLVVAYYVFLTLLQLVLALQLVSADADAACHRSQLRHAGHGHHNATVRRREDIQADYLCWVARVGDRLVRKGASTSQSMSSSSEWAGAQKNAHQVGLYGTLDAVTRIITVNKKGSGHFKSVQAAINSVPSGNIERVVIQIEAGVYEEKVKIPKKKPYITFQGAAAGETVITWHDNARSAGSTFKSASVSVMSDGFIAKDITFSNTAPYPHPGSTDMQAVAFQISGDRAAFYNCRFLGTQDTLYDHKGRHYFRNCYIQGSVDFIFGGGLSLYQNCELRAIAKAYGSFTAQKRKSKGEDSGFSFVQCKLTGSGVLYLGRAWGPYSRVVFVSSYIDAQIKPDGWYNWGDYTRERTVFYGEYQCRGPGANMKGRVVWSHQLSAAQAAPFMSLGFVDGEQWIAQ
ncbi:hypothetical protein GOP47_0012125 [Adiantum capillus-veneris]|uniref:Pectinesterase n=1 Tax=Adiantum capillus-veneris TaxID=13818 RepID=A0A9D4UQ46_ADICA|nr:hypothetical protein GOP47_0012125 [Adiantum capillus-veneris]